MLPCCPQTIHTLTLCLRLSPLTGSLPQLPRAPRGNTPFCTAFQLQPYFFAFKDWQQAAHIAFYLHI